MIDRLPDETRFSYQVGIGMDVIRNIFLLLLSLLFIAAGVNHFLNPGFYLSIMPPYLPWHRELVAVSGVIEILLGIAVVIPISRTLAGWMLVAMLIAFMPVHIHMAINPDQFPKFEPWKILLRLPLQALLIAWVYWTAIEPSRRQDQQSDSAVDEKDDGHY